MKILKNIFFILMNITIVIIYDFSKARRMKTNLINLFFIYNSILQKSLMYFVYDSML